MPATINKPGRCNSVGKYALKFTKSNTKVQQHKKEETDINNIVKKYHKTGVIGNPLDSTPRKPMFGDFSIQGSYHEMLNTIKSADNAFLSLSANVRKRFENDPQKALEFVAKRENTMEAVKLGLLDKSALPMLMEDPNDIDKRVYVDVNLNKVDPVPGQMSLEDIHARIAARKETK